MNITGDWLAGFIDGEGSFNIAHHAGNYQPRFSIKLRDDDSQIIKDIHDFLGVGTIGKHKTCPVNSKYYTPNVRDQFRLTIVGKDNMKLVSLLDQFLLRTKKIRDYEIWKKAVEIYSAASFNRWSDKALKKARNDQILNLKIKMEGIRKYEQV